MLPPGSLTIYVVEREAVTNEPALAIFDLSALILSIHSWLRPLYYLPDWRPIFSCVCILVYTRGALAAAAMLAPHPQDFHPRTNIGAIDTFLPDLCGIKFHLLKVDNHQSPAIQH